jgi:hypothetical protein
MSHSGKFRAESVERHFVCEDLWVGSVIYFIKYFLIRLVANILELIMSLLDVLGRPVTCTL